MMIAPWAAAYVGIPFEVGGSSRAGCDCWGLLALAYREVFGITVPLYAAEYQTIDVEELAGVVGRNLPRSSWRAVPLEAVQPGDGLLLRVLGQGVHVGLAVGDRRFLHAVIWNTQSCIERIDSPRWARRLLGVYRYDD